MMNDPTKKKLTKIACVYSDFIFLPLVNTKAENEDRIKNVEAKFNTYTTLEHYTKHKEFRDSIDENLAICFDILKLANDEIELDEFLIRNIDR